MTVSFAVGAAEVFESLPDPVKVSAARSIGLLLKFPEMFPIRRRGLMEGYRYFVARGYLFYYSVTSREVRILAIIPARMEQA